MPKKKVELSLTDKLTITFSGIALIISITSVYFQLFHRTTNLQIGEIYLSDITDVSDTTHKHLNINLLLLNVGTNPIAFTESYSFFSKNESLPKGSYYYNDIIPNDTIFYTCCHSNINKIVEPNTVKFINLNMSIKKEKLLEYVGGNTVEENPYLNVGVHLVFVDSKGKKTTKELIVGSTQLNSNYTKTKTHDKLPEELMIY